MIFFSATPGVILGVIALIVGLIWRKSFLKKAKKLDAQLSGAEPFDYNPKSSNKVGIILVVDILVLIAILVIPFLISGGGK